MLTGDTCPLCHGNRLTIALEARQIDRENEIRESFVIERLGRRPDETEAMDLTRFMHGGPGRLLRCSDCGLLLRDEDERAQYESDVYDPVLMKHLYPRYRGRSGASEHNTSRCFGAMPRCWKWAVIPAHFCRPVRSGAGGLTGLDIGNSTSTFARQQGGTVKRLGPEDYSPKLRPLEAIFIWNCFEQMEDPSGC